MAKKFLSALLCVLLIASSVVMAGAATAKNAAGADTEYAVAARQLDNQYGYNGNDLGATYSKESTTFKVWAPTATEIKLNLFATGSDSEEGAKKLGTYQLKKELKTAGDDSTFTGIWKYTAEGDLKNKYYTYTITAKNVTGKKTTTKETADVYSVATGVNGKRSMICDLSETDPEGWDKDAHVVLDKNTKSSVWEVHVKDFSYNENSGVSEANRGKYLAFTETGTTLNNEGKVSTCIDYLKELGITTVQINPFYDYGSVDESGSSVQFNWGYDPVNYNVPEGSYSTNPYDGNVRIKECKQMIQALHNAGISVVMDVVYNHTYSADSCFERTVPNYYYRMKNDGSYSNGSGCGNETASENLMFRNYMIQSCLYWVNEYHVDGFRFDLMALHDVETMNLIRAELDKVDPKLTTWGEGWTGGSSTSPSTTCTGAAFKQAKQSSAKDLNERVGFFNDGIRDGLKGSVFQKTGAGWIQGTTGSYQNVIYGILANVKNGSWHPRQPSQCVTYASCHDNQTLWDRLCDSQALNDYFRRRHPILVAENKLTGGILAMSQGVTFMLAGEEMGRSKDNDENSYASDAKLNMLDWEQAKTNADIVSYYKGMLKIRNSFSPLYDDTNASQEGYTIYSGSKNSTLTYAAVWDNKTEGEWSKLAVLANADKVDTEFTIEERDGVTDWVIIANDKYAGVKAISENGKTFKIPAKSMVIAVDKASFDKVGLKSDLGVVTVKHVNGVTGETIEESAVTGTVGSKYSLSIPSSLGKEFDVSEIDGDMDGTFKEDTQNVTVTYGYYVPESVKTDLNGDGKYNINDVTYMQRALANIISIDDAKKKQADVNFDGVFDVNDVTMYQKGLARFNVSTGHVIVNYYNKDTNDKILSSVDYEGKVGETYEIPKGVALGYQLDTTQLPEEKVVVPYGTKEVNFYYTAGSSTVTLNVKHSGSADWDPSLWIWGSKNGDDSGTNYCKKKTWPGDTLTAKDGNGWYTTSFDADEDDDSYNFLISDSGSPQSIDCKGFAQSELWIVIDDSKDGVNLVVYDVNPDTNPEAKPFFKS